MEKVILRRKYKCPICHEEKNSIKDHVQQVHEKFYAVFCNKCDASFVTRGGLNRHVKHVHDGIKRIEDKRIKKKLQCPICLKEVSGMKRHVKRVHYKSYECNKCDKVFTKESALDQHRNVAHGVKRRYCPKVKVSQFIKEVQNPTRNEVNAPEKHMKIEPEIWSANEAGVTITCQVKQSGYDESTKCDPKCSSRIKARNNTIPNIQPLSVIYICPVIDCTLSFECMSHLKDHLKSMHKLS